MVQLLKGLPANQLEIIIILTAISIVAAIVTNFSPDYTPWYSRLFWLIRLWDRRHQPFGNVVDSIRAS